MRVRLNVFNASVSLKLSKRRSKPLKGIFIGAEVINPFSGDEIPVFIASYVLLDYGTGAVMGVPAHDNRDFKFATEQQLPVKVLKIQIQEKLLNYL